MSADVHAQKILILDFGSPVHPAHCPPGAGSGVYSEIRAFDMTEDEIRQFDPGA